ncbi:UNVERIFIED_CONTAM: hypothetical protein Sindi_2575700 [Sesamum indicum]
MEVKDEAQTKVIDLQLQYNILLNSRQRDCEVYRLQGIDQDKELFYRSDEYKEVVANTKIQSARAFMKSPVFNSIVDSKMFEELLNMWDKLIHQTRFLGVYNDDFDVSLRGPSKDEKCELYPEEEAKICLLVESTQKQPSLTPEKTINPECIPSVSYPSDVLTVDTQKSSPTEVAVHDLEVSYEVKSDLGLDCLPYVSKMPMLKNILPLLTCNYI